MEYNGLIVKSGETCYLFFEKSKGDFSQGLPLNDYEKIYDNLLKNEIGLCKVQFCDGTESVPFESFESLEDIYFQIKDLSKLVLKSHLKAIDAIKKEGAEFITEIFEQPDFK